MVIWKDKSKWRNLDPRAVRISLCKLTNFPRVGPQSWLFPSNVMGGHVGGRRCDISGSKVQYPEGLWLSRQKCWAKQRNLCNWVNGMLCLEVFRAFTGHVASFLSVINSHGETSKSNNARVPGLCLVYNLQWGALREHGGGCDWNKTHGTKASGAAPFTLWPVHSARFLPWLVLIVWGTGAASWEGSRWSNSCSDTGLIGGTSDISRCVLQSWTGLCFLFSISDCCWAHESPPMNKQIALDPFHNCFWIYPSSILFCTKLLE